MSPCPHLISLAARLGRLTTSLGRGARVQVAEGRKDIMYRREDDIYHVCISSYYGYNAPACVQSHPLLLQLGAGSLPAVNHQARGTRDMPHLHTNSDMVSIDSLSCLSVMIFALQSQFHIYLLWVKPV